MEYIELTIGNLSQDQNSFLIELSKKHNSIGANEYNLNEEEVDKILGDRSYCGGDITEDLIDEILDFNTTTSTTFYFNKIQNAENFRAEVVTFVPNIEVNIQNKQEEDWNLEWKKHYEKIVIDEEMDIVPSWQEKSKVKDVFLYPGQGFGTGSHETTFLCLKLMSEVINEVDTVFDHGCGSGILAIASKIKKSSLKNVEMYDIDEKAIENSFQNLVLNKLSESDIRVYQHNQKEKIQDQYDLVFANILLPVLVSEFNFLNSISKKKLIVSGLLENQFEEFYNKYSESFNFIKILQKGDWIAILMDKK